MAAARSVATIVVAVATSPPETMTDTGELNAGDRVTDQVSPSRMAPVRSITTSIQLMFVTCD